MRRFLVGDELGNIKSITYSPDVSQGFDNTIVKTLRHGSSDAVQVLAVGPSSEGVGSQLLVAGFSSGLASSFFLDHSNADQLQEVFQWKETRLRDGQKYIGLEASDKIAFSCTSNGALRSISFKNGVESPEFRLSSLPTRLRAWRMTSCQDRFAYGGDEVDVSVWDTEQAFTPQPSSDSLGKKRKRDTLFPGELWRAKNVQNDNLGLRSPLRITCLTYLASSSASHHLAAGTGLGNVHRYDTRASKRPVSDWKIAKNGGIKSIEKGMSEHELFAGDHDSNLYTLDLRNGRIAYRYQGLSGAVTSLAPSPTFLASAALDRFVRIHSTSSLEQQVCQQPQQKGQILDKVFMKCTPTTIVWDSVIEQSITIPMEGDDVWETLETTGIDSDGESKYQKRLD
ncbi:WD repeat-containing protein 74 [Termitomyces sp. T112]|nr:WD repeat-containing protein 74 [Termitomyces sp. T112]KAH0583930.1 hypothetical protein H2248_009518 [Termitomyces sp. 'cryptogamus']